MSLTPIAPWARSGPLRLVGGLDLGLKGAISLIDANRERVFHIQPLPYVMVQVGKKQRRRLDYELFYDTIALLSGFDVELWGWEIPGVGYGAGGRELGEIVGAWRMLIHAQRLRQEKVSPAQWKRELKVPADKIEACLRAEVLFPHDRDKLRGTKGGRADGKAEAAMIALFCARKFLQ